MYIILLYKCYDCSRNYILLVPFEFDQNDYGNREISSFYKTNIIVLIL